MSQKSPLNETTKCSIGDTKVLHAVTSGLQTKLSSRATLMCLLTKQQSALDRTPSAIGHQCTVSSRGVFSLGTKLSKNQYTNVSRRDTNAS